MSTDQPQPMQVSGDLALILRYDSGLVNQVAMGHCTPAYAAQVSVGFWKDVNPGSSVNTQLKAMFTQRSLDALTELYEQAAIAWGNRWTDV